MVMREEYPECKKVRRCLKQQGLRMTLPRKIIIEVLSENSNYLSAEEVFMIVHNRYPGIGLATVYRTLNLLADMGIVTKYEFGEGKARYELTSEERETGEDEHFHQLVCTNCFEVVKYSDFSNEELELMKKIEGALEKKYGYKIDRHVVQFYGMCPKCQNSTNGKKENSTSANANRG